MIEQFVPVMARSRQGQFANAFKSEVRLKYLPEKPWSELPGGDFQLGVEFHFFRHATGDIDNLLKTTLDTIKGSLIKDDRQIKILGALIKERSTKEGVLIKLSPIEVKFENKPFEAALKVAEEKKGNDWDDFKPKNLEQKELFLPFVPVVKKKRKKSKKRRKSKKWWHFW